MRTSNLKGINIISLILIEPLLNTIFFSFSFITLLVLVCFMIIPSLDSWFFNSFSSFFCQFVKCPESFYVWSWLLLMLFFIIAFNNNNNNNNNIDFISGQYPNGANEAVFTIIVYMFTE